jgi:hypothetical protein
MTVLTDEMREREKLRAVAQRVWIIVKGSAKQSELLAFSAGYRAAYDTLLAREAALVKERDEALVNVRQLSAALPTCHQCGGSGHIDHDAKTTGNNQHSAAREQCDRCDGLGVEL